MSPRVGDGLVRLDGAGPGHLREPQRAVGLPADRGRPRPRGGRAGAAHPVGRRRPGGGGGGGRGHLRRGGRPVPRRHGRRGALGHHARARPAAARARGRGGRARAGARRHRRPAARPRPAHQGRHDPRDPPPGEEQPADRGGAAAAAGAADDRAGGPGGARGVGAPGRLDRGRARDAGRQPGGRRRRGRRPGPGAADARRPRLRRAGRRAPGASAPSGSCRPPRPRRWCSRSPSCCTTPPSTPSPTASRGRSSWSRSGPATTSSSACGTTAGGCRRASTRRRATGWGCRSCGRWSPANSAAACRWGRPTGEQGTEVVLVLPGAGLPRR